MGNTASAFLAPTATEQGGAGAKPKLTAEALKRRLGQRRQIQGLIASFYVIDALILLIYGYAGTVPVEIGPEYAARGFIVIACMVVLSETGIAERSNDHYLITPTSIVNVAFMLAFTYVAPQVGVLFLCSFFTVFGFSALRSTPRQTAILWTAMALGLAWLFLMTDKPISIPSGSHIERFGTMMVFVLTIGRCTFLGLVSGQTHRTVYQRGLKLKEAYQRIEELSELDELTGSFNRHHIMRMLDEEITRAHRAHPPCSIALIDLDWFKRINDTHGHLTGDEVLRTFAITMFANIREIDRFGRYGGEEFLLVLPETPGDEAARILDRLRAIIADLDWSAFSAGMQVTISAGVATLKPGEWSDTFLARADKALYEAKAQGRNRIAIA
jgi:diguanylate cyclase (GGDEF)-like protein